MIPLHQPFISGNEIKYIEEVIKSRNLSGNGKFTNLCHQFLQQEFNFDYVKLTDSCTAALDMVSILLNISPGDEVIVPSYTYITSANPFVLKGAKIVYADSLSDNPNIDPAQLPKLFTEKTKVIVVMHYGGIACEMDEIMEIANSHNIYVVEDAAHSLGATYKNRFLGSIGHFGAFSFHTTKNVTSGHGGLLVINDEQFYERAEIIWEKGTNRKMFLDGEVNKYEWYDVGLSFYPSEITAAFLWAQLQNLLMINAERLKSWDYYYEVLKNIPQIKLLEVKDYSLHNAHLFCLKTPNREKRNILICELKNNGIMATFHYLPLHLSPYAKTENTIKLKEAEDWADSLVRIPLYYDIRTEDQDFIIQKIKSIVQNW
ncbi:dTDP-4-amino-4,6-dideoxygalactose transaminase [Aequorivita sp. H23M31]|uniref:dTDP-4-amino-4,6-dideoxygalactose transaminase n=1 Tax=Aequorivita ciconiae TaxID=2494375 RepID=A0A410G4F7_9FLAO|nr:dTDP-4-amino-4,6-dideoxygalactose transaminase [Aequorivita sp. H23M31]QAA82136.1 dTDP-4-amino-4,6-dideoxygalactose transaminase [Aequorivita sp. H23M31]